MTVRVAIVDDHPVVRDGMAALLREQDEIEVTATAADLEGGRELMARADIDVLLLDLRLGKDSGLALLSTTRVSERPAIVLLTAFDNPEYVAAAMRLGAAGFVLKSAPIAELVNTILGVSSGAGRWREGATLVDPIITPREQEILREIVIGRSNDEIGAALSISIKTVEGHLGRIFERVGVNSRAELAARAVREGWLDVPTIPRRKNARARTG
jgi:DNA-binding NarL/FixJ family response regulator